MKREEPTDDFGYTPQMLQQIVVHMRAVVERSYWMMMSTNCHPFIELNGLMAKFVDVCDRAAKLGIPFPMANEHSGIPLPVEEHDLEYLGEKLRCIFGPIIDSNESARRVLFEKLFGDWRPS